MIRIDTSKVDPDKLTCQKFLDARDALQGLFEHPDIVDSFCVHEAAHYFYYRQAGVRIHKILGPSIEYRADWSEPVTYPAQIQVYARYINDRPYSDAFVHQVGKIHSSGKVASLTLTPTTVGGEKVDCKNFITFASTHEISTDEQERLWTVAETEVRNDLNDTVIKAEIWRHARELKQLFFDPLPSQSTGSSQGS